MKTALYVENNNMRLILTPENSFEQETIKTVTHQGLKQLHLYERSFFECVPGQDEHISESTSLVLELEEPPDYTQIMNNDAL